MENTLIRRYNNFCANDIFEQNCGMSTDENYWQVGNNAIDKQRNDKTISKHKDPMITKKSKSIVATEGQFSRLTQLPLSHKLSYVLLA